jgi:single-strand DNA-binding protein
MAGDTVITVIGNLTADPELRFTPSGAAVANFTVASTPRTFDRQSNEWKDGETLFLRCSVWREAAENVAESLQKGMRVIVQGRLKSRSYDTKEGERRTVTELDVDEVGPSLRYASAKVNRNARSGGQGGGFGGGGQQGGGQQGGGFGAGAPAGGGFGGDSGFGGGGGGQQGGGSGFGQGGRSGGGRQPAPQAAPQSDPWSQSSGGNYDWGSGQDDEPPF